MFTNHDRAKEQALYIANCPETTLHIENTPEFSPNGVAMVKTFLYKNGLNQIKYNKWIVEGAEFAAQMQLPGYQKHNNLVKGSGVRVLSQTLGHIYNFYGQEAQEIIAECEQNHLKQIQIFTNNFQR